MAGSEPKRSLQDWGNMQVQAAPRAPGKYNPVEWLKNGRTPSLWLIARLLFALGCLSLIGEFLAGVFVLTGSIFFTSKSYASFGFDTTFWGTALANIIIISIFTGLFFFMSALTVFLAGRNDREASALNHPPVPPSS
jgi:hypothetical protein